MISLSCSPDLNEIFGFLLIFSLCASLMLTALFLNVHKFLCKNNQVIADTLIVEGWMPDYAIKAAMKEFETGSYRRIITIGGPIQRGSYLSSFKSFAELAAATLVELGLDSEKIFVASNSTDSNHRTYDSAVQLQQCLKATALEIDALNLFTLGVHSRRSWILFKKVFEPQIKIGAIAATPLHYDSQKWWKSSEGARTVLSELIAYLYVRLP